MWRTTVVFSLFGLLVGCRAPMPTVNTFSPFSATRVAPPSTGSYGAPGQDQYYPGANQVPAGKLPGVSVGVRPTAAVAPIGDGRIVEGAQLQWQQSVDAPPPASPISPAQSMQFTQSNAGSMGGTSSMADTGAGADAAHVRSGVVAPPTLPASHFTSTGASSESAIRIVEQPATSAAAVPQLQGMAVNDASREPQRFEPDGNLIEISKLAPATTPPIPSGQAGTPTSIRAPAPINNAAQPAATPSVSDPPLRWQTKVG